MREMELVGAKDGDEQQREEEDGLRSSVVAAELRRAIVERGADSAVVKAAGATRTDVDENDNRSDEAPLLATAAVAPNGMASNGAPATAGDSLEEMELKYAAYVRDDSYGALGRGALPLREKAMLLLAFVTIVPIRFILLILVLLTYYIICRIFTLFRSPSDEEGQENYGYLRGMRRFIIVHSGRFLSRVMLFVLGFYWIKVTQTSAGTEPAPQGYDSVGMEDTQKAPGAIVSNHVSYLDILYHMSASFPSFVAKRSVAKLPLVGLISKCLGCIYVQRESKTSDTKGVSGIVAERLRAAHSEQGAQVMLLFPEGTTTNGEHLLPFKTGAFLSQTPVLPVILKYPHTRFSPAWESISGVRHILLLLCQPVNYLEVVRLPVYCPSAKEKADPKLYASSVRKLMAEAGGLTLSDIGLLEKRIYLNALKGETAR